MTVLLGVAVVQKMWALVNFFLRGGGGDGNLMKRAFFREAAMKGLSPPITPWFWCFDDDHYNRPR